MPSVSLSELCQRLQASADSLAALGAAMEARLVAPRAPDAFDERVEAVVRALGATEALDAATPTELRSSLGGIRVANLSAQRWLFEELRRRGWAASSPELLTAAGDVSVSFPKALQERIAPQLEGLSERLSTPGARVLDVGVGVAAMSVELAQRFPHVTILGIDPLAEALVLGRDRVAAAGLTERIELRQQRAEDLVEIACFDLTWVPSVFVPASALPEVLERVRRSLKPGGWTLLPHLRRAEDPLAVALLELRSLSFGGPLSTSEALEALLRAVGHQEVITLPSPPHAMVGMLAARG